MRKILFTLATIVVLAGLFVGSWFVTGMLSSSGEETAVGTPDTSVVDGDATVVDATTPGDTAGTPSGGPQSEVIFPLPADIFAFEVNLGTVMRQFGANSFAKTRVMAYASIAWYETLSLPGAPTFISEAGAGQGPSQAMLAAGAVAVELLDNPEVAAVVEAWEGDLSEQTAGVVAKVAAYADADGYNATANATAPTFDGEFAWKTGSARDGVFGGYEPAYGKIRTIAIDPAACPVDVAPIDALRAEKAALASVDKTVPAPIIGQPSRFTLVAFAYMNRILPPGQKQNLYYQGQNLAVALHDAMILTWKANWENGVAAPVDMFAGDNTSIMSSYPSYPSWTDVAASATEAYVSNILGNRITMDTMIEYLLKNHDSDDFKDQIELLREDFKNSASSTHHWNVDREAGRKLGTCVAGEALKALSK